MAPSGESSVIAASLVSSEDEASFAWVFLCFLQFFRRPPAVLFTDSDPAMAAAAAAVLLSTLHLLCIWHLSKNLLTNVKPAAFLTLAAHKAFMDGWWKICLQSDKSSVATFDREWAALLEPLKSGVPSRAKTSALEWLDSLYARRKRWAARWTYGTLTYTMHSTGRGEAVHSALKAFCSASMLLTSLLVKLDTYSEQVSVRSDMRGVLRCLRLVARDSKGTVPPLLRSAALLLQPYPHALLEAQHVQSMQYVVRDCGEGQYRVQRVDGGGSSASEPQVSIEEQAADAADGIGGTPAFACVRICTLQACSCQTDSSLGLPCRHQLAVARQLQVIDATQLKFARHWLLVTDAQRAQQVRLLLATPPPAHPGGAPPRPGLLKADRLAVLQNDFRSIAAAASETPGFTEWLRGELQRVGSALRGAASGTGAQHLPFHSLPAQPHRARPLPPSGAAAGGGGGPARGAAAAALVARQASARAGPSAPAAAAAPGEQEHRAPAGKRDRPPRSCRICGQAGHRADNSRFHPDGAAGGAAGGAASVHVRKRTRRTPLDLGTSSSSSSSSEEDAEEEGEGSDDDDITLAQRFARSAPAPLPAGLPPPPPVVGGVTERRRGEVSRAAQPGGGAAPPIGAPRSMRSKGRPKAARIKSGWERRG